MTDFWLELVQVLMSHHHADTILAQFREHVRNRESGETLEFIDVYEEGAALFFRHVCPAHRVIPPILRGLWKWNFLGIFERGDSNEEEQIYRRAGAEHIAAR